MASYYVCIRVIFTMESKFIECYCDRPGVNRDLKGGGVTVVNRGGRGLDLNNTRPLKCRTRVVGYRAVAKL